jgi:hypothetical protein
MKGTGSVKDSLETWSFYDLIESTLHGDIGDNGHLQLSRAL